MLSRPWFNLIYIYKYNYEGFLPYPSCSGTKENAENVFLVCPKLEVQGQEVEMLLTITPETLVGRCFHQKIQPFRQESSSNCVLILSLTSRLEKRSMEISD